MEIAAIGLPVPETAWTGRVHSVFKSSVNLMEEGGLLLCVHRFDFGVLPGSYYVPRLDTSGIRPGDRVRGGPEGLWIGGLGLALAPGAERVDTAILPSGREVDPEAWRACRAVLERRSRDREGGEMIEELYRRLRRNIIKLRKGLKEGNQEEAGRQCREMVGLGQGLTPTGDDMLLGALAALHMYRPELAGALGQAIAPLLERTNDISRSYLGWARRGRAATPVVRALSGLASGDMSGAEALLGIGHSSGGDILEGMLFMTEQRER